ncbi:MAG: carbon-nitrogen hydrolase family protein [Colwellia sp.]|nr:carbon-nitrogen hydrolase family protein [Colwellia sp.]
MARLSAIQLCSVPDVNQNLAAIAQQLTALCQQVKDDEHIVVLPECCLFFGGKDAEQLSLAQQTQQSNQLVKALAKLAQQFSITLVAGTIPLLTSTGEKFTNTCCVFSPKGVLLGQYDKIHLFDVNVNDSEKNYLESKYTEAGKSVEVVEQRAITIGLSVCYDVRFAALYRKLTTQGATVITVPSAFTRVTGKAHWQALLQARAIENQVYIVAAAQEGIHANGRETWGHSMIISPWGEILVCKALGEGFITCEYHQEAINRVRAAIPVHEHNKFTVELNKYD